MSSPFRKCDRLGLAPNCEKFNITTTDEPTLFLDRYIDRLGFKKGRDNNVQFRGERTYHWKKKMAKFQEILKINHLK